MVVKPLYLKVAKPIKLKRRHGLKKVFSNGGTTEDTVLAMGVAFATEASIRKNTWR